MIFSKAFRAVSSWLDGGGQDAVVLEDRAGEQQAQSIEARDIESLGDAIFALSRDLDDTLELIRQLKLEVASVEATARDGQMAA